MDIPTAWAFVRQSTMADHHEACSYRRTTGAILCDCTVLWDAVSEEALAVHSAEVRP